MLPKIFGIALALSCALLSGCVSQHPTRYTIPNFDTVDAHRKIYRGGEPLGPGWQHLKSLGVGTVVKLNTNEESTDCGAKARGLTVVALPITETQQRSGSPDISTIKCAVREMRRGAVFVHCGSDSRSKPNSLAALFDFQGGQDRTSLVVGCYRVWVEHQTKAKARVEMKSFHFHALLLRGLRNFWRDKVN
jgi:protein tyrosine/serine phosphatase